MLLPKGKTRTLIIALCILFSALSEDSFAQNIQRQDTIQKQKAETTKNHGGQPDFNPDIRMRTICGLTSTDNSPLLVIDNALFPNNSMRSFYLRKPDVKKVTIFSNSPPIKAVYGSRAENGVVLIETKNGRIFKYLKRTRFNELFRAKRLKNEELNYSHGRWIFFYMK